MRPTSVATLERWRSIDATIGLAAISEYAKRDDSYVAKKNLSTSRWHASVGGTDYELLLTGPKYWDVRARKGGGGAVDLVMHLLGCDFRRAVKRLKDARL